MIYRIGCLSFISFLILLLMMHFSGAVEPDQVSSVISHEIEKQRGLEAVLVKFDNKIKKMDSIDQVEVVSVLVNGNNNFSAMVNTEDGASVLSGTYYEAVQVPVLQQPIKNGTIITEDAINMAIFPANQIKNNCILKKEDLVGKVAKRRIMPGKMIRENDIEMTPLIKKGEAVVVRYTNNNLLIETTGISTEVGVAGKIIRVKNVASNKMLHGKVVAPGIVEVHGR
ncbi:MAG: flagellar basal body P-ring formation chaperone FlgA [Candidatus Midichloria sp.]|nr:flagellar basal body P-ring formation chaperone FlgA [Candidatus Midichloria sp.]